MTVRIFTSNFAQWQRHRFPGAISISRYPDYRSGWTGPEFPPLMPSAQLLAWYKNTDQSPSDWTLYSESYKRQLMCLDPMRVYNELGAMAAASKGFEPVLLCYESAKTLDTHPCHRRLVAAWFKWGLGVDVPEWGVGQSA